MPSQLVSEVRLSMPDQRNNSVTREECEAILNERTKDGWMPSANEKRLARAHLELLDANALFERQIAKLKDATYMELSTRILQLESQLAEAREAIATGSKS